jgi:pterin-4a-carbinolamine dehydratase
MAALSGHRVDELLLRMSGWHRRGHELVRIYPTGTHLDGVRLAARLTAELEPMSHEPTIGIQVDGAHVRVDLHTPDEGGITEADVELAERLDRAAQPLVRVRGAFGE